MDEALRSEMAAGHRLDEPAVILGSPIPGDEILPDVRARPARSGAVRHELRLRRSCTSSPAGIDQP